MYQHVNDTLKAQYRKFFRIREYIHFIFGTEAIGPEIMCPDIND